MGASVEKTSKHKCFVISTIGEAGSQEREDADLVLDYLVKPALGDLYEVVRGDEDSNPGSITPQIVESILEADLIVADLTGFNPNVYYEVAIAHGYERPTVHLQIATERPAFDLKDMRLVRYNMSNPRDLATAVKNLRDFATYAAEQPKKVRTPLSGAKQFLQIEESEDPIAQSNLEIIEQLRRLRSEVRRAVQPVPAASRSADIRSLRAIIDRTRRRGALREDDISETVTSSTSPEFDEWIRGVAATITGETDAQALNAILFDADVRASYRTDREDEDSDV